MRFFVTLLFILISFNSSANSFEENIFDFVIKDKDLNSLYQKIYSKNKALKKKDEVFFHQWQQDNKQVLSDFIYFDDLKRTVIKARLKNYLDNFEDISSFDLLKRRIYDYGWPFFYFPEGRIQIGIYNRLLVSGSAEKALDYIKSNFRISIDQERFLIGLTNKRSISLYGNDFDNDGITDISIKVSNKKRTCSKLVLFKVLQDNTILLNELPKKIGDVKCINNFVEYIELNRKNYLLHYVNNDRYENPFAYIELYDLKTNKLEGKITITYSSKYSGNFTEKNFKFLTKEVNSIVNNYAIGETTLAENFSRIETRIPEDKIRKERKRFEKSYGKNSYINYLDIDNSGLDKQIMFVKDSGKETFLVSSLNDNSVYDFDERFGNQAGWVEFSGMKFYYENPAYFPVKLNKTTYIAKFSFAYLRNKKQNLFIFGIYKLNSGKLSLVDKSLVKPELFVKDFQF